MSALKVGGQYLAAGGIARIRKAGNYAVRRFWNWHCVSDCMFFLRFQALSGYQSRLAFRCELRRVVCCIRAFFRVGMDSLEGGETVAIRDYWVFQERQVATPWALYIVKEYETPQTFENTCLDVTIYHEDIDNDEHALSFVCWRFDTISGYTDEIQWHLSRYTLFNADDYKQVDRAIFQIFMDK